jgi:hypothetical protein
VRRLKVNALQAKYARLTPLIADWVFGDQLMTEGWHNQTSDACSTTGSRVASADAARLSRTANFMLIESHRSTVRYQGNPRPGDTELRNRIRTLMKGRPHALGVDDCICYCIGKAAR